MSFKNKCLESSDWPDFVKEVLNLIKNDENVLSIWLIGSRANNTYNEYSDWDFIVFTDEKEAYQRKTKNKKIDIIRVNLSGQVLLEGKDSSMIHSFEMWEWEKESDVLAKYTGKKFIEYPDGLRNTDQPVYKEISCKAFLIWEKPKNNKE